MRIISEIKATVAFALAALFLAFSCTKEFSSSDKAAEGECFSFNATLPDSDTKTYLDGVQVKWEATDRVAIWYGTLNTGMTRADYHVGSIGDDARHATLDGFAKASDDYMAVYPLSAARDCSKKGKLTVELPMKQALRANSFASGTNVSVAYSSTTDLSFKNVGGYLAFKVSSTGDHTIREIRLTGTAAMAGEVEIKQASIATGDTAVDAVIEGINFLTLDCGDGIEDPSGISPTEGFSETPGTWESTKAATATKAPAYSGDDAYYLVSLPGSHTGFALTFVDSDGKTAVAKSSHAFEITRNSNTLITDISLSDDKFKADKQVFINEIHTHNNQIELWNPNDFSVDLTGWILVKDEKSWAFPVGSVIPANGYKVITAGQTDCASGPMFGISGDKGFVLSLVSGTTVDKVDNSGEGKRVIGTTETYGRKTDGADEWVIFSTGTIFEEGVCDGDNSKGVIKGDEPVPVIDYTGLVINELNGNDYDADNGNDKFIELYNGSAGELDLTGVVLKKDDETVWTGTKDRHVLASGAYLVLYSNKSEGAKTCPAENVFNSGLSPKKAVRVQILTPGGQSIDDFNYATYSGTPAPASYGRNSGSGEWYYQAATPGAVNADGTEKVTGLQ